MTTYTDVFGTDTIPPSGLGYEAVALTADTTFSWPYNADGNTTAKIMGVSASSTGLSMIMPPANQVSSGEDLLIRNVGANAVYVKDNAGNTLQTVNPGAAVYLYITNNSTVAGVWGSVAFGVGTSSVDAATLIGYGIKAIGSSLNQSHPTLPTATGITLDGTHRAKLLVFTGGVDTFSLTSAATLGDDYFCLIRNDGTGTLTIDPAASETVDGLTTLQIQPSESLMLICTGTAWYTVGYGRSVVYQFTQLTKDVSAGGTITLTAAEASNKLITFIGSPAGAVTVIAPSVVAVYYTYSNISTAQTITFKTAAGSGVGISQGARIIAMCDGTNMVSAQSAVANSSVSLTDGTAANPSLYFSTQTNTGLYKYGTNGLGVAVAGVDVGRFTSTGLNNSPVGASTPASGAFTTLSATGDLTLSGSGKYIKGDFTSSPVASRVSFMTSTTNGNTYISANPNGTGDSSAFQAFNALDQNNTSYVALSAAVTEHRILSDKTGTGAYKNLHVYVGGSSRANWDYSSGVFTVSSGQAISGGNLNFSGTAQRITGDFSNATVASRVMFQTSTVNGISQVAVIPNGTGNTTGFEAGNSSDPSNNSYLFAGTVGTTDHRISGNTRGTGTYLPMTFYTGGSERMRIDTSGNVGVGTNDPKCKFAAYSAAISGGAPATSGNAADPNVMARFGAGAICMDFGSYASGAQWIQARSIGNYAINYDIAFQPNGGNTLHVGPNGGLGYGTGAGGTVTQATSKSTTVTLNKPTGQITMNNAALAAGTAVQFTFNNSLLSGFDILHVTLGPSGITPSAYTVTVQSATGSAAIVIRNHSAGSLSEAIVLNFAIIKGAGA